MIPSYPYAIGGHHFSNGKTWAERFAQGLQLSNGGKASLANPGKNGNYAFGGARARSGSGSAAPNSSTQVSMFLGDYGAASSDALYVIQFGGNDIRDALVAGATDPGAASDIIQAAITAVASDIQTLYFAGARKFLVANSPNLAHAPAVRLAGASGPAGVLSGLYNGFLEGALQQLEMLPGIEIHRLDMAGFIDDVVASPADFGIANAMSPCLMFFSESDAKCENADEYLFWDGIHPTAAAHQVLADEALGVVSGN